MRSSYTCNRCLTLIKSSRPQLRTSSFRPNPQVVPSQRSHSTKSPAVPKKPSTLTTSASQHVSLPRRNLSSTTAYKFDKPFEPYEYVDPEGITRKMVLAEDNLFHPFTNSPIPEIRKRAAFMRQHAYCPHPSHKPTRQPTNPMDLESRKSSETGTPPRHVDFECPDCGIPVYCCEEHWADDYEAHLGVCDIMRQSNEDDHDLRSGRFFKEFEFADPQIEEILVNMTSWDTYLYTRDFDALNEDREMRQATALLTYPMTIASIIHELSPYSIRGEQRLTPEGLKSFSALRHSLHPARTGGGDTFANPRLAPPSIRLFILGARGESSLPRDTWLQLAYLFHRVQFSLYFIGPEAMAGRSHELPFPGALPERTPLNPFGAIVEDRISNAMKISTIVEYYHTIHKTGYFYPYDPYFDCFILFHPGFGNPRSSHEWADTLPLLLETKCPVIATGYSPADMQQDVDALEERFGSEMDILLKPDENLFRSLRWDLNDYDPHDVTCSNWGVYAFRGKRYETTKKEEGEEEKGSERTERSE
ncbi:zinc-finger of mitochondrial splicing suppressor 51-domain-containing protein [Clohesyomyces aquaticus]|uniref:Zinc-finger of mitochondrial splicing suppressor 51-domain-containing protein n=1 Tax=Clohesyomyces aquaticus TaxID=1231657 RepID=A0A1Y2A1J6_9PLEO|nr:zinc-finger of mitochondrial splicing suppressor 51-domain-containing protein [Clohesyomyces aquaticus]